jgi:rubrerythrin
VYLHVEDEEQDPIPSQHSSPQSRASLLEDPLAQENDGEAVVDELDEDVTDQKSHQQRSRSIHRSFNLIKNLEKIHCERYAESLIKEGFGDEVSL